MESYQKLKAKIEELEKDNYQSFIDLGEVIDKPDSLKSLEIKIRYKMLVHLEQALWNGSLSHTGDVVGCELIGLIKED